MGTRLPVLKPGLFLLLMLCACPGVAMAQALAFGPALSDGAVLQRGQPIIVSGTAEPGTTVHVTLDDDRISTTADPLGRWWAALPARAATTALTLSAASGAQSIALHDVSVGDVFLCSGQSNMAFSMAETALNPNERRLPIDRSISLLSVPVAQARVEQAAFASPAHWSNAHAGSADFSAVCLLAGREIARSQQVPVGLVDASMGGTPIESWLPYEGLVLAGNMDEGIAMLDAFRADPAAAEARHGAQLDAMWAMPPPQGQAPDRPRMGYANLFNAMLAPLRDMRLAGVIWYQGENNARRPDARSAYRRQLQALLASWRQRFGAELPFVIVQLAAFGPLSDQPDENGWAEVREAQRQVALGDPLVELVVTSDVGERLDIHPPLKKPVGQRAAAALAHLLYGGPVEALGPRPLDAVRQDGEIRLRIAGDSEGLIAASWGRPGPFILCASGPQRDCRFADARLVEGGIAVTVPTDFSPDIIRYCWGAAPICNVFDHGQRPLGPFELSVSPAPAEGQGSNEP